MIGRLLLLASLAGAAAVRTYDFFEGEDLLHDLRDELWIRYAELDRLDARWAANQRRSELIVSWCRPLRRRAASTASTTSHTAMPHPTQRESTPKPKP